MYSKADTLDNLFFRNVVGPPQQLLDAWGGPQTGVEAGTIRYGKCGGKRVDVRPNWKEAPGTIDDWRGHDAMPGWH
jgi:hypothetical protein